MNLAATASFNADFDGDEMNIHVPSSLETVAELQQLMATEHNIISAQSSKTNITIVQDALLGNFLMTKGMVPVKRSDFFNIIMAGEGWDDIDMVLSKINHIENVMSTHGKEKTAYSGRGLFSLLLPDDLLYEFKNDADPNEPVVRIVNGVLIEGTINKSILGSRHGCLIEVLNKDYSNDVVVRFINNVQFIANAWLLTHGFSISIRDCIPYGTEEIQDQVTKCCVEADYIASNTINPIVREARINGALNKGKDRCMKFTKDHFDTQNNFISTISAGSKGDYFNIAQITSILGQQNLGGKRIPNMLSKGRRSLPHYPMELNADNGVYTYESRGFIRSSFIGGLNPKEYFFHAMTGREGITDTAMKTADSGYIQRKMVKLTETAHVAYDGTVRTSQQRILQFQYGDDGMDGTKTIIRNGKPKICDVKSIVNFLNNKKW